MQRALACALDLIADWLYAMGLRRMDAQRLKRKHVDALVQRWRTEWLDDRTLKNRMEVLHWWAVKIRRRNIVARENAAYGIAERVLVGTANRARDLTAADLAKVTDPYTALSLQLQAAFGLRRAESLKIQPAWADRGDRLALRPTWCKGGRAREIPIRTEAQRTLLDEAKALAGGGTLIPRESK